MTNNIYTRPDWINKASIQYQGILMWLKNIEGGKCAILSRAKEKEKLV